MFKLLMHNCAACGAQIPKARIDDQVAHVCPTREDLVDGKGEVDQEVRFVR